jgi:hypothetical protein
VINLLRNSVFSKILWGIMGLFLLNISVDIADPNPENIPEDLSINDQESIIEIIVEKILGYENAIEEYDDNDAEDQNKKTHLKIELVAQWRIDARARQEIYKTSKQRFPAYNSYLRNGFQKLDTPHHLRFDF